MKIKFMFQGLDHTQAIEDHITKKINKLDEFIAAEESPRNITVHIKKDAQIKIELNLSTKSLHLDAHSTDYDLYAAADDAVAKLITQIKKHKEKTRDKRQSESIFKRSFDSITTSESDDINAED